ncbi:MAG: hypothetical protein LUD72_07545, partial [Bacteroidales bacterium]|nr:hypothetical protein [Bacteroidales bacterium]
KAVDLENIIREDVKTDLKGLFEYFDGFDSFIGDTAATKHIYWKLMNLIFVSPFMAMLRYTARKTHNAKEYFPVFVVINGKKSAGKTQFIAAMQKLMFNIEVETAPCDLFTKTNIGKFFEGIKGVPVCFDDMAARRFKDHSSNVVKNTEQYAKEEYSHHPIFIITTNEIDSLPPDLTKRIYYAEIPATQENESAIKKKRALNSLLSRITGSFYRAYLKEMVPAVSQMIDQMDPDSDTPPDWEPDVFKLSSETIINLVRNVGFDSPEYMTVSEYKDYFGYNNIKEKARAVLLKKQKSNPDMIRTDRRENYLEINAGDEDQASKLYNLMPEIVEASTDGTKVLMKLTETEKYFQISFRKGHSFNEILRKAKIKRG